MNTVGQPSKTQVEARKKRALPQALMGGTPAMRAAETIYLPKEEAESDKAYGNRINRTYLFNGFGKTVKDLHGKVFAKPLQVQEDASTDIRGVYGENGEVVKPGYIENIDLTGQHLNNFASNIFEAGLVSGIEYIFVDMPPAVQGATRRQEQQSGNRPYMVHVTPDNLLGWKARSVDGVMTLTQVRMLECSSVDDPDDPFAEIDVEKVRVVDYEPGVGVFWRLYRKEESDGKEPDWILEDEGPMSVSRIPLVPVYINRTDYMQGECPLSDLAQLNLAHWQSTSDQRNILHVARVPILLATGFDDDVELVVGANSYTSTSNEKASLKYVEHDGKAIGAGRDDLKDLEFQMQAFGLQLMLPKPGGQTATGEAIDEARMVSDLAMMADSLKDALEAALGFMNEFKTGQQDGGGSIDVNKDFGISLRDAQDITAIIQMVNAGQLSRETAWKEMIRRGFLAEGFDPVAEEDRIASGGSALGMM